MASTNAYTSSLRQDKSKKEQPIEEGVPFFVPQLSKVKTGVMCQTKQQHLLFCYEKDSLKAGMSAVLSYRKQGNQDMYSEENLQKRKQLQDDRQVQASINRFWETFPSVRLGRMVIEKREFIDVFIKFYKALVTPNEFSIPEARKIVEKDWQRDVGDSESMSKVLFFRSLFEVTDIWTVGIGVDIYVSFLNKLFDRVTMTIFDQEKSIWLTVFAELDKIRSLAEPRDVPEQNQEQDAEGAKLKAIGKPPFIRRKTDAENLGSPAKEVRFGKVAGEIIKAMQSSNPRSPLLRQNSDSNATVRGKLSMRTDYMRRGESERAILEEGRPRSMRGDSTVTSAALSPSRRSATNAINEATPEVNSSEVPRSPVKLSMPSIYLNPDFEGSQSRKLQETVKNFQGVRRPTY